MAKKAGLAAQVRDLRTAADLADGRADKASVDEARRVTAQVDRRLQYSGDATVCALAGATGSGKSSLFNAVSGTQLAKPGVRRPTTSQALAAMWTDGLPSQDVDDLLNWLEVPQRVPITGGDAALKGLVLLDLPDHDSVQVEHRLIVDRLVALVDMFVWVVDPQKYADAALHDQYLKPLAKHAEVMVVVLNQVDRVDDTQRDKMLADLRKLLDSEGLGAAKLMAVSAMTGDNVDALRALLAASIQHKQMAAKRLSGDVAMAADGLRAQTGTAPTPQVTRSLQTRLSGELATAAGAAVVQEAVLKSWRRRGALATGWPVISWVARFRPDPLKRLHLDVLPGVGRKRSDLAPVREQRTSLPMMGGVARARVDNAIRAIADEAGAGLPRGWADAVRTAARTDEKMLPDELDRAIGRADLGMSRGNGWWGLVRVLQWLLIAALVAGLGWIGLTWLFWYFQVPPMPLPKYRGVPYPTLLAAAAAILGIVLALLSRLFVEWGARVKANAAGRALRKQIADVTASQVVAPVQAELERYGRARDALARIG